MSKEKQAQNNYLLYNYLRNKGLIDEKILMSFAQRCNQDGSNLGHTLVQNRLLSMNDLSTFFQHISTNLHNMKSTSLDLKVGVNGKDFGKYVLVEEIARGGMGIVYKAMQKDIKRVVALKVMMDSEKLQPRFLREAQVCATLNHPHIVPIYEIGTFNNVQFFSMQYIEGITLADVLKEKEVIEKTTRNVEWLVKIAEALFHSHEKGIIHRDIKPSNILIDKSGCPFLADFGLAKMNRSDSYKLTKTGEVIGTPFFMSPEQVNGHKLDARTDIYSLGVILYQVLTSQLPFSGNNLSQLYRKILRERPVPPKVFGALASLSSICLKALEKDPQLRYQKADKFAQDLQSALAGEYREKRIDKIKKVYHLGKKNMLFVGITLLSMLIAVSMYFLWDTFQFAAQKELQHVEHLIAEHQYNDAKIQVENLLKKSPNNAEIHAKLAQVYFLLKDTSHAIESISTAIKLQPDIGYRLLKARWLREKNLHKEALAIYQSLSKDTPQVEFEIAHTLFAMKKYDEARNIYTILLKKTNNAQIKLQLGKIYFFKNDFATSLNYLQEVEKSHEVLPIVLEETFYYLGKIYTKQQLTSQAITMFKRVEKSREKFTDINLLIGFALAKQQEFSEAISYLELENEYYKSTKFYRTLASCYQQVKNYTKAIEFYSKCIKREPWQFEFYTMRGLCYGKIDKMDESGEDFLKASMLGPNNVDSLANLYQNVFRYRSLEKRYELEKRISHLLLMRYKNQSTNLFDIEYQRLAQKYMDEYDNIVLAPIPQPKQIERFITLAMKKKSEIKQIATSALHKLYHSKKVLYQVAKFEVLQDLHKAMSLQYEELQRKYARQLLVRYYIINDESALNTLHSSYIEILKDIAVRDSEHNIMRFFALKTLVHMREVNTHHFILRYVRSSQNAMRLMSCAALVSENISSMAFDRRFKKERDPFLRMLQVKYLLEERGQLRFFLQDENIAVRLTAANKLWQAGYLDAEKVFITGFSHHSAAVRAFACSHFWNFRSERLRQYTKDKYLPLLAKTLQDPDAKVQRIAILRMSQLPKIKVLDFLKPLLDSQNNFVKLQALIAIGVRGDLSTVVDFIEDNDEAYLQASLFAITKLTSERKMRSLSLISLISNAIENNSSAHFTIFLLKAIGRAQKTGARYIYKYIDHPRESVRLGTILGLYRYGDVSMLPKIAPFLDSKIPIIQDAAAFTTMSIVSREGNSKLMEKYQKIIREKKLLLNGSYAYVRDLHIKTELGSVIRYHKSIEWDVLYPLYFRKLYAKIFENQERRANFIVRKIHLLKKALNLSPQHHRYLFFIALLYHANQNYGKARECLQKAITIKPLTVYHYWLALAHYAEGNYDASLEAILKYQKYYFLDIYAVQLQLNIYRAKNNQEQVQKIWQRLEIMKLK
ncbi:serine/threonine-protein kinase [Candidatus Uabimicrobium amorphum]|uniref:non-specific serine/threonine protein kinase n=1 Tax=Uabimicrobium amorphum TaxID=2596890 RepID=A0A5S9IU31_UABAM|nr:serine/threonine-protein kinase [Candidatus Uabimicrobium amorphum]BBM87797.1 protein kinase [Candidatus Uabimicrobium amorphum]